MVTHNQGSDYQNGSSMGSVLAGLLIGAAAGAAAMLLLAPQSGRDTRMQIRKKGIELRDRTTGMVDDAMEQVRSSTTKLAAGGRQKAEELKHQGQELLADQLERVSAAAQAGKKAVQSS
ncbi:MAG: YtxH domain-containing protein [Chloroflexota bacterium]